MQISYNTLVIVLDYGLNFNQTDKLTEFFSFHGFGTTVCENQKNLWSKVNKAQEYGFDYILTVDASQSNIPEDFTKLFEKINDAELVIGKRQGNSWVSKAFNAVYVNFQLYQDWFSSTRLYRIETLLNLSKFSFSDDLDKFNFETLAKATELGCVVAEVELTQPMQSTNLSLIELSKLWLSLFNYQKAPTYHEQSLY